VSTARKTPRIKGIPGWAQALMRGFYHLPLVNKWHPWLREDKTDMRWLPINEDIERPDDTPMPLEVLDRIIEEASHRAIFDYCGCRKGWHCKDYPTEIGCLLMGDSCLEASNSTPFREVGVEEAKAHARKAVEAGLVPIVGKARADNFIFKIKDRHKLLTVCFCCECCCVTRFSALAPLEFIEPTQPHLESLQIDFDAEKCKGCGKCVPKCYMQAIAIVDKKAVISEFCRACGRCAIVCPNGAIELKITDPEFVEKTLDRIRSYVTYD
jgi:ferredoxin